MSSRRRLLVPGALLAAASASVGLLAASGEAPETAAAPAVQPAAEPLRTDLLNRAAHATATSDLFAPHSWQPPPPPRVEAKVEPPPPPPRVAPPVPFAFLGTLERADGKPIFYLAEGERVHAVSEGDTIDDYRVEALGVDGVVLTYLPLNTRHTLAWSIPK